jgi:hypothetical protein
MLSWDKAIVKIQNTSPLLLGFLYADGLDSPSICVTEPDVPNSERDRLSVSGPEKVVRVGWTDLIVVGYKSRARV